MKNKIIMFVIGLLVGAVLTAGGFLIFGQNKTGNMKKRENMPGHGNQIENNVDEEERTKRENGRVMKNQVETNETTSEEMSSNSDI